MHGNVPILSTLLADRASQVDLWETQVNLWLKPREYWPAKGSWYAANKQFLAHIKHRLKINLPVRKIKGSSTFLDEKGKIHILKSFYALSLGAKIFDKMTKTLEDKGLFYLKRKTRKRLLI